MRQLSRKIKKRGEYKEEDTTNTTENTVSDNPNGRLMERREEITKKGKYQEGGKRNIRATIYNGQDKLGQGYNAGSLLGRVESNTKFNRSRIKIRSKSGKDQGKKSGQMSQVARRDKA